MIWSIEDPVRSRRERELLDALAARVEWLFPLEWRVDASLRLIWDADIVISTDRFPISLRYPNHFPHSPPLVLPRGEQDRWSSHQYGAGGELCLEYGPDNWHPEITGADMIESAHRLLSTEHPTAGQPARVASRHSTTLGQDLRGSRMRMLVTHELVSMMDGVSEGEVLDGTIIGTWRNQSVVYTIGSVVMAGARKWIDKSIPKTVLDEGYEKQVAVLRLPVGATLPSVASRTAFSQSLAESGILLPDVTYALIAHGEGLCTYFLWKEDDTACAVATIPAEEAAARLDQSHAALNEKKVAMIGCGSLGSKVAAMLARSGVGNFLLVDDDVFLPGNVVRHELDWREMGFHKADALARRIALVNSTSKCETRQYRLGGQQSSGSLETLVEALAGYDLIIDATADPRVFNYLCAAVQVGRKPLLWAEVFGGGYGGMIARHRPGIETDPATMRATIEQWCAEQGRPIERTAENYETRGEGPTLIADDADVTVIAAHAARYAIDLLIPRSPSAFPHSVYLIGLRDGWVFDQPFDTRPIEVGPAPESNPEATDPRILAEETARLMQLLKNLSDASSSSAGDSGPTAT